MTPTLALRAREAGEFSIGQLVDSKEHHNHGAGALGDAHEQVA